MEKMAILYARYARYARKMLLDHFVSKMVAYAQYALYAKDVWFDSYDEEGTLRSLAWTVSGY